MNSSICIKSLPLLFLFSSRLCCGDVFSFNLACGDFLAAAVALAVGDILVPNYNIIVLCFKEGHNCKLCTDMEELYFSR